MIIKSVFLHPSQRFSSVSPLLVDDEGTGK